MLESYISGAWQAGSGDGAALIDPTNGTELARASTAGLDMAGAVSFARDTGGAALGALTYGERAALLAAIAGRLKENYGAWKATAMANSGNTGGDADMDVGGAIFTLKYYARLGAALGERRFLTDGDIEGMSRDGSFHARHILVPRQGVAIHINAFNFPAWGLWEKAAVSLLAGVPTIAKPATATALLAHDMVRDIIAADILPVGALSLICGGVGDLLDHVTGQDVIAFTGSATTAGHLRTHPAIVGSGAHLTVEADSVNASVLGPDAGPESAEFTLFVKEVVREMTFKAGQKCTAIRRIMVPRAQYPAVEAALAARLAKTTVGDPRNEAVRMGPLVNRRQQKDVLAAIDDLASEARFVTGQGAQTLIDADNRTGCFVAPTLLACDNPVGARKIHDIEAFGPVSTLMPYDDEDGAVALVAAGKGCLASSVFTADTGFASRMALRLAPWNGRLLFVAEDVGASQTGHGNVMPGCVHGGPGRAGGGEELGGLRGLSLYHQRTAIQGNTGLMEALGD